MDLVDKWVAGVVKMRVFTDKWPDCSCVVVFFQEWLSHDLSDWESGMLNSVAPVVALCIFIGLFQSATQTPYAWSIHRVTMCSL